MTPRLIGLTGYAQHGKNTVAEMLEGYRQVAFADSLRFLVARVNPYVIPAPSKPNRYAALVDEYGYEAAKKRPEVRRLLQEMGTAVRDILGPDVWVGALQTRLDEMGHGARVVVTDVRFPNEADFVRANGGEVWAVQRLDARGHLWDNGLGVGHPSEAYVEGLTDRADVVLRAKTLEELRHQVHAIPLMRAALSDPALD